MNGWGEVNDILDLIDHIWVGIVLIACAAVPSWLAARNHKSIKEIRDNVQNGHKVPLREDLDKVIVVIENLAHNMQNLTDDMTGLRQDLLAERDSRKSQVEDLRDDVDRMRRRSWDWNRRRP